MRVGRERRRGFGSGVRNRLLNMLEEDIRALVLGLSVSQILLHF
jgi:hypothetical protein